MKPDFLISLILFIIFVPTDSVSSDDIQSIDSLILDLPTIRVATDDFADTKMIGQGGFGMVYKGVLPDGQEIAVKRLCQSSRQGIGELKSELILVAKLYHKNLVRLIGVCLEQQEKILVYEYMPNGSLDIVLFGTVFSLVVFPKEKKEQLY
jgi:serine/threonine protein kinase